MYNYNSRIAIPVSLVMISYDKANACKSDHYSYSHSYKLITTKSSYR